MKTLRQYKKMVAFLSAHTQTHTLPYLIITGHTHATPLAVSRFGRSPAEPWAEHGSSGPTPWSRVRSRPSRNPRNDRARRVVPATASTPHGRHASSTTRLIDDTTHRRQDSSTTRLASCQNRRTQTTPFPRATRRHTSGNVTYGGRFDFASLPPPLAWWSFRG